jgi:hypothetical protein
MSLSLDDVPTESDESEDEVQIEPTEDIESKQNSKILNRFRRFEKLNCLGKRNSLELSNNESNKDVKEADKCNDGKSTEACKFLKNNSFASSKSIKLKSINTIFKTNIFHRKYQTNYIDVWWLYDDGGKYRKINFKINLFNY